MTRSVVIALLRKRKHKLVWTVTNITKEGGWFVVEAAKMWLWVFVLLTEPG